ncbi:amino acid permease 1-like [Vicia villosa]|uniref:amino acid permease 1-like n=1 Tax=Vicia villosa TaxID=3911 RepID=UPI00273CBA53|nr:amino acid permease 1-like [Vicia villosa]XP_058780707.1 amino acid permease 1-like [Vicia villosa]
MKKDIIALENGVANVPNSLLDDDGRPKRTGTVLTAAAHIINAVIGTGVLSLPWAMSQMGWTLGISCIFVFSGVTLFTSNLLADCYRSPDPVTGKRNTTYMEAVKVHLGGKQYVFCGLVQYINLSGFTIGFIITTSTSIVTILKNNCYRKNGFEASCRFSNNPYMITIGLIEIVLSQIPNFHKLSILSVMAATMAFGYASIGVGLSLSTLIQGNGNIKSTTLFAGNDDSRSTSDIAWNMLVAIGDIALASAYAQIAVDIQDSLKSSPPENKTMKKANALALFIMTIFFILNGCAGYAAFGSNTPGNILMSSGFRKPFWLLELANVFIVVHLVGAFQVLVQPVFRIVEMMAAEKWPNSSLVTREIPMNFGKTKYTINYFRLLWRTIFVIVVTVLAMAMPFFNAMIALLGAVGFWPSVVYFPVEMYIVKQNIRKGTIRWIGLQTLSIFCFIVSLAATVGAIHGLGEGIGKYKPFMYKA